MLRVQKQPSLFRKKRHVKVIFDIDCTFEKALASLILPDVKSMKAFMMLGVEARMNANLDMDILFKTLMLDSLESFEYVQKVFFSQLGQGKDQFKYV